jgi:dienelactone hydrolase
MVRPLTRLFAIAVVTCAALSAGAQDAPPKQQEFLPKSGKGRVVVLISGSTGPANYTASAQQIADAGFHVVLVDGNDYAIKDTRRAWNLLKDLIARSQQAPSALPGKVGVVAFSLGGASALTYAARMPDTVATVVTVYPTTSFIKDPADFVSKMRVPVQILTGTADTYKDCCLIQTARQLADAAKASTPPVLELHEYEGAGHAFNLPNAPRKDQAFGEEAMERTVARLKQALPAEAAK